MRHILRGRTVVGAIAFVAVAAGFAVGLVTAHSQATGFRNTLTRAGYHLTSSSSVDPQATATVSGCKLGFKSAPKGTPPRILNGKRVPAYTVSLISQDGKWTVLDLGSNTAPTDSEVQAYLELHRPACFTA